MHACCRCFYSNPVTLRSRFACLRPVLCSNPVTLRSRYACCRCFYSNPVTLRSRFACLQPVLPQQPCDAQEPVRLSAAGCV